MKTPNIRALHLRKGRLVRWLRDTIPARVEAGAKRFSFVLVEGVAQEGVWMHASGHSSLLDCITVEDWKAWGSSLVREWWGLSALPANAFIDEEEIQPSLLRHQSRKLTDTVFMAHGSPVAHFVDAGGLNVTEPISALLGSELSIQGVTKPEAKADIKHKLEDIRVAEFDGYKQTLDSSERFSKVFLQEIRSGVHRELLETNSTVLRKWLPMFKLGAPRIDDVRAKLEMEKRLRIEEGVTGSLRPLVFTLEALQDTSEPEETVFPGLWRCSVDGVDELDLRSHMRDLLLWDSALALIAGAVRCHVGFKSGLLLTSKEPSRTLHVAERRFSKKNSGAVTSVYLQVNTQRLQGYVHAVASRIISLATHELAHAATYSGIRHPEVHTLRWEGYLTLAAECVPAIQELVAATVGERHYRPVVERTMTAEQFIMEEIRSRPQSLVSFLALRWAEFRNITENGALEEIGVELHRLASLGRLVVHQERVVYSLLGT